ncbi:MAG: PEP-CTERM sorting domain-containing protein [Verrucomicrobiota bacterium]
MNPRKFTLTAISAVVALSFGLTAPLSAQHDFDDGGVGSNWNTADNWDPNGVPDTVGDDLTTIGRNGANVTVELDSIVPDIFDLRIGDSAGSPGASTGTLNFTAGSLTTNNWTIVGVDGDAVDPANGTFNLSGTASYNGIGPTFIGSFGSDGASTGTATLSGLASYSTAELTVGHNNGNSGTFTQSGGTVTTGNAIAVGRESGAVGIYNQTAGTATSNNWITVGETSGATGTYNISGGTVTATTDFSVGQQENATGNLNVSGTATVNAQNLRVGRLFAGGGGATGNLVITGSNATILTGTFELGGESFSAADATGNLSFIADLGGLSAIGTGAAFLNDGTVTGTSSLLVDLTSWSQFTQIGTGLLSQEITLIDSNDPIVGTFAGLAEGASISVGGGQFGTLSYVGGSGTDITLTVLIPEPSVALLSILGVFGLVTRRRRR